MKEVALMVIQLLHHKVPDVLTEVVEVTRNISGEGFRDILRDSILQLVHSEVSNDVGRCHAGAGGRRAARRGHRAAIGGSCIRKHLNGWPQKEASWPHS